MYLLESKIGRVRVYGFDLDEKEAKRFRINEMKRLKEGTRVYRVTEKVNKGDIPIFTSNPNTSNLKGYYHKNDIKNVLFEPYEKAASDIVLNTYYSGLYSSEENPLNLVKIRERNNSDSHAKYYLVGFSNAMSSPVPIYTTTTAYQVIRLPKSLYLLHALEQGNFNLATGYKISRELDLFDAYLCDSLPMYNIIVSDRYGITKDAEANLERRIIHDEPLIRVLKQEGRI